MVLGLFEGSIKIELEEYIYSPGQTIKGMVQFDLNRMKKATALRAEFYGLYRNRAGGRWHDEHINTVEVQIGGRQSYGMDDKYKFELQIPKEIQIDLPKSVAGSVFRMFYPYFFPRTRWYVHVTLDVPLQFAIQSQVPVILIAPPSAQPVAPAAAPTINEEIADLKKEQGV